VSASVETEDALLFDGAEVQTGIASVDFGKLVTCLHSLIQEIMWEHSEELVLPYKQIIKDMQADLKSITRKGQDY
jgi:hypothetical protein